MFVQIARSGEPLALDQGLFACFGEWPDRLPYRDLFDSKPPLFLYTWTLAWSLGGTAAVWWFAAAWLGATMVVCGRLAARLGDRWTGVATALLIALGLWAPELGGWWSRAQAEELLALPLIGAAAVAVAAVDRPRRAVWVGVLSGVTGLYKIPALVVAVAWPVLWAATCRPWRGVAIRWAWFAAGVVAPWLLAAGWFAAHGAIDDLYAGVIVYARHNAEYIAPPIGDVLAGFARTVLGALGLPLATAAIGVGSLWWRARSTRDRRAAVHAWWLALWIGASMVAVVAQRQLAGYHFLLIAPGLAVAGGVGVRALVDGLRATTSIRTLLAGGSSGAPSISIARVAAIVGAVAVGGLAWKTVDDWRTGYGPAVRYRFGSLPRDRYLRGFETGPISPSVEESLARYLRAHSTDDDGVLIWGLAPATYALAGRRPATRYPFHKLLMTDAPLSRLIPGLAARRAELMERLVRDPPAYIIVGTRDANGFEPEDSVTSLTKFSALARFVDARYRQETTIGRFLVMRRQ